MVEGHQPHRVGIVSDLGPFETATLDHSTLFVKPASSIWDQQRQNRGGCVGRWGVETFDTALHPVLRWASTHHTRTE